MIATPATLDIPIYVDEQRQIRISRTRVLLELVVNAFNRGESAEDIMESYSSLSLADVYAVIAYYLNNRTEIDAYIHQADKDFQNIQQHTEQGYSEEHQALLERMRAWRDNHTRSK